jgi:hypothetical protein
MVFDSFEEAIVGFAWPLYRSASYIAFLNPDIGRERSAPALTEVNPRTGCNTWFVVCCLLNCCSILGLRHFK